MPVSLFASAPCEPVDAVLFGSPPQELRRPRKRLSLDAMAGNQMWELEDYPGTYLPSREMIAAATAKIRSGWSEEEYRERAAAMPFEIDRVRKQIRRRRHRKWLPPGVLNRVGGAE